MARFCPLFSSSSGNSWYIGSGTGGILVDAGVSAKRLDTALNDAGLDVSGIHGIFITHEHTDHVSGLRVFASRHQIPVYTSRGTLEALTENGIVNGKYPASVISEQGIEVAGMKIQPFPTPHDCREGYGYVIHTADDHKVAVCTDLGEVTDVVLSAITGCELVVMESNHDVRMLENGPYPYPLKRRILSSRGHLSNDACGRVLTNLLRTGTRRFFLGHLSTKNNNPYLAKQTSLAALTEAGAVEGSDYLLQVVPKVSNGALTIF